MVSREPKSNRLLWPHFNLAHAKKQPLATKHIQADVAQTKPLSVVMAEGISVMRDWAAKRTVLCD